MHTFSRLSFFSVNLFLVLQLSAMESSAPQPPQQLVFHRHTPSLHNWAAIATLRHCNIKALDDSEIKTMIGNDHNAQEVLDYKKDPRSHFGYLVQRSSQETTINESNFWAWWQDYTKKLIASQEQIKTLSELKEKLQKPDIDYDYNYKLKEKILKDLISLEAQSTPGHMTDINQFYYQNYHHHIDKEQVIKHLSQTEETVNRNKNCYTGNLYFLLSHAQLPLNFANNLCMQAIENNLFEHAEILIKKHHASLAECDNITPLIYTFISKYSNRTFSHDYRNMTVISMTGETYTKLSENSDVYDGVDFLIANGADVSRPNKEGSTPLHLSAKYDSSILTDILLNREANIHAVDNNGRTPLIIALLEKNFTMAKTLINAGADVNQIIDYPKGEQPLQKYSLPKCRTVLATLMIEQAYNGGYIVGCDPGYNYQPAIQFLLLHGANPNLASSSVSPYRLSNILQYTNNTDNYDYYKPQTINEWQRKERLSGTLNAIKIELYKYGANPSETFDYGWYTTTLERDTAGLV